MNVSSESDDLEAGTKLDLPLWLAENIGLGRGSFVSADIPRIYKESYREILKADASTVDLNKLCSHFYEFGKYVAKFDDRDDVADIILETFKSRFRQLMNIAQNSGADPMLFNRLDLLERAIYKAARKAHLQLEKWLMHTEAPMEAAEMVLNHKKRKRAAIDVYD